VLKWTSPILLLVMHQRGWFEDEGIFSSVSLAISGFIVYFIAFSIRGTCSSMTDLFFRGIFRHLSVTELSIQIEVYRIYKILLL
jgi:hypothetical protein